MIKSVQEKGRKILSVRIIQAVLDYIIEERLSIGSKLPSQISLSSQMGISLPSLREAFVLLEAKGIIVQKHGLGTFVARDPLKIEHDFELNLSVTQMIRKNGRHPGIKWLEIGYKSPDESFGNPLPQGTPAFCISRIRTADEVPFSYSTAWVLLEDITLSRDNFSGYNNSLYQYLQDEHNIFITHCEGVLEIHTPPIDICQQLDIPGGSSLLQLSQRHYDVDGSLIILSKDVLTEEFKISMKRYTIGLESIRKNL